MRSHSRYLYNGEILAMVSHPAFDPNLFSGKISEVTWKRLQEKDHPVAVSDPLAVQTIEAYMKIKKMPTSPNNLPIPTITAN